MSPSLPAPAQEEGGADSNPVIQFTIYPRIASGCSAWTKF